jgi:hypothetical protein
MIYAHEDGIVKSFGMPPGEGESPGVCEARELIKGIDPGWYDDVDGDLVVNDGSRARGQKLERIKRENRKNAIGRAKLSLDLLSEEQRRVANGLPPSLPTGSSNLLQNHVKELQSFIYKPSEDENYTPEPAPVLPEREYDVMTLVLIRLVGGGWRCRFKTETSGYELGDFYVKIYENSLCGGAILATVDFINTSGIWHADCPAGLEPNGGSFNIGIFQQSEKLKCVTLVSGISKEIVNIYKEA